jgi:hypothetical protein
MKKSSYFDKFGRQLFFHVTVCVAIATTFVATEKATAAEWSLEPIVRLGLEYDTGATLTGSLVPAAEIQGYVVDGTAIVGYSTERTKFTITPTLRTRDYEDEFFDSDDQFLALNFSHRGLKSNFGIRANYDRESARTAERQDADPGIDDPDDIFGDDTGTLFFNARRELIRILPQWGYDFSEKTAFDVKATYTDVEYDRNFLGSLVPYSDVRVVATLYRSLSTRTRGYANISARRYKRETLGIGGSREVDGVAFNVGIERNLTQTAKLRAEVGVEESKPKSGGASDSNAVWDINYVKKLETIKMLARYKRSINASGTGRISLRDSINLGIQKPFSERLTGGLGVAAYSTEPVRLIPGFTFDERDYAQVYLQLAYALSPTFSVQADYRYTYIDRSTTGSGDSNNVALWLIYQPTAMTTSR